MDLIFGSLGILLPILFVLAIAWHEGLAWQWIVYGLFSIAAIVFFVRYMGNLAEWQIGLFGVMFALAIVGVSHLFEKRK